MHYQIYVHLHHSIISVCNTPRVQHSVSCCSSTWISWATLRSASRTCTKASQTSSTRRPRWVLGTVEGKGRSCRCARDTGATGMKGGAPAGVLGTEGDRDGRGRARWSFLDTSVTGTARGHKPVCSGRRGNKDGKGAQAVSPGHRGNRDGRKYKLVCPGLRGD